MYGPGYAMPFLRAKTASPIASLPLLAALIPAEHNVTSIDENVEPIDFARCARADIVGVTGMIVQRTRVIAIIDHLKPLGVLVVSGGRRRVDADDGRGEHRRRLCRHRVPMRHPCVKPKTRELRKGGSMLDEVRAIQCAGLEVWSGMILGFDNDHPDIFDAHRFITEARIINPLINMLVAIHGTPPHARLKTEGRLDPSDEHTDGTNVIPLQMSREELQQGALSP